MNDIPENIQRFLKPQTTISNQNVTEEKKDILDDVITKEDIMQKIEKYDDNRVEYTELSEVVNPFESEKTTEKNQNTEIINNIEDNKEIIKTEGTSNVQFNEIEMPSNPFNIQSSNISEEVTGDINETPQKSLQEQLSEIDYESFAPSIENLNANYDYNKIERIEPTKEIEIPQEILEVEAELSDEDGELSLPKIINKVRDFSRNLGRASALIDVEEIDLPDKYQITIQIRKN